MPALEAKDTSYDANRMAAYVLGVHLVSQVLDEACTVVAAAQQIGCPQACVLSVFKDMKSGRLSFANRELLFKELEKSIQEIEVTDENPEQVSNIATSTPEKDKVKDVKEKLDSSIECQGDEEIDVSQEELSKSTSMFINNLFDMSEVEKDDTLDDKEVIENESSDKKDLNELVSKIMGGVFDTAVDIASDNEVKEQEKSKSSVESCYSFLADAYEGYVGKDNAFYIDDDGLYSNRNSKPLDAGDMPDLTEPGDQIVEEKEKSDAARYENAYLTLNRDYEQCSDEDGDPVLQDPKVMVMQEVELINPSTSGENVITKDTADTDEEQEARKQLAATSAVSGASGSRKSRSSLVSRCRSQGAKLLACLRGWWRRKSPGKRKENRAPSIRGGMCPLSPSARRRAASFLDHRDLYSPVPSRSVVWKFNTVNEAFVNSGRWKEYTFEMTTAPCSEYC